MLPDAMTPEEQKLLAYIMARQDQKLEILLQMLESKGIIEPGDRQAFATIQTYDPASNARLLREAKAELEALRKLLEE